MYHTDSEYLKTALDCGMIDMATLQAQIDMAEKLKYLEGYHIELSLIECRQNLSGLRVDHCMSFN